MDWSTIIVAGMALLGTLVGSYFSNSKTTALISYRISQLEEKVQKHNNLVERMAVAEKRLETAFSLINDIRDDVHDIETK